MANENRPTSACLDPETIAAFIDGRLQGEERTQVESHIARCSDCYDLFVEAAHATLSVTAPPAGAAGPAQGSSVRSRRWLWAAGLAAAVLLVASVFLRRTPADRIDDAMAGLVASVGESRFAEARVSDPFAWGPPPVVMRGDARRDIPLPVQRAMLAVQEAAQGDQPRALRAAGVAALATGDLDRSITLLDRASAGGAADAHVDYAAALFERWRRDQRAADLATALDQIVRALRTKPNEPAALFDQALILEGLGLKTQADAAWNAFLAVDATSRWADEARAHVQRLRASVNLRDWRPGDEPAATVLAREYPGALTAFLETYLRNWHQRPSSEERRAAGIAAARLRSAGRARTLTELVASSEAKMSDDRQACLARLFELRGEALTAFEDARSGESARLAEQAGHAASCAGVLVPELTAIRLQAQYAATRSPDAVAAVAQAATAAEQERRWDLAGRLRQTLAAAMVRAARFDAALSSNQSALDDFDKDGDLAAIGAVHSAMGEVFQMQGDAERAWEHYREALGRISLMSSYRQRHIGISLAATAAESQSLPGTALWLARELEAHAERSGNGAGLVMSRLIQARSIAALGAPADAAPLLDAARQALPAVADERLRRAYGWELSWHQGRILQSEQPRAALAALDDAYAGYRASANHARLAEVLLTRGYAERQLGHPADAEQSWAEGVDIVDQQRQGSTEPELRISRVDELWDLYSELIEARKDRPALALETWERGRARALLDALGGAARRQPLRGSELYEWLPAGVTVLAYSVHPQELMIFIVDRTGVRIVSAPVSQSSLERMVRGYVAALERNTAPSEAAALGAWLLPRDLKLEPNRPLVVIPDAGLHSLPFATLPIGDGRALVQASTPIMASSLTTLRITTEQWAGLGSRQLLTAASEGAPARNLAPLRGTLVEVQQIAQRYSAPVVLEGKAVTRDALLRRLSRADVFHFAGHALSGGRRDAEGLAVFGDSDLVTPDDIIAAHPPRGMVAILSGCETGLGSLANGEGAASLSRAFTAAGASAVVASLWRISDADVPHLLVDLHSQMTEGVPPPAALAAVQRNAIARHESAATWGAFQITSGILEGAH